MNWNEWKQIQHSMFLEGWKIGDEELKALALEYEAQGYSSLPEKIVQTAESTGRPLSEVAAEVLSEFRLRRGE